ncbi:A24 family peptidase C-terminal domain-containing protein [Pyrococcus sp. ST04]|uniref:A24 family peptidase C-terminal domain-containing protein n=1 Tax=Pyrococcus sp. ST04 TaxID=1183377 RepID=UPI00026058DB|nr:A24 family peptidase C-terminal domain-containing protein [Pyrococcus sp. ST04]AFK22235.1 hypothetical protein Py04_0633 [Pyrococcus sp. ST04]
METIPLVFGVIVGFLTSYTDIRTSYIYEEHFFPTFSLLSKWWCKRRGCEYQTKGPYIPIVEIAVLYYFVLGVKQGDISLALSGFIGLLVGLALGALLYYTGGWASGDVLILGAFSAILPYAPAIAKFKAPYATYLPLNSLTILFDSLLLMFPLLFVYSLFGLIFMGKLRKLGELFLKGIKMVFEITLWVNFSIILFVWIGIYLGMSVPNFVKWIVTVLLLMIFGRFKLVGDVLGVVATVYGLYFVGLPYLVALAKLFAIIYGFKLLFSSVKLLRKEVLTVKKSVEELREGDVLGERIVEVNGEIVRDRKDFFDKLSELFKTGSLERVEGREIAGFSVEGLTKEQIEELKSLVSEGKLENEFLVRKAMPFAPALFAGFLASYFFGDILWWLILKVSGLA